VSLATRCTACGTVFRVVQDQLRVSGGWVRCGRCGEVFNAIESLVDLEIDRPAEGAPPSTHAPRVMQDLERVTRGAPLDEAAPPPRVWPAERSEAGVGAEPDAAAGAAVEPAAEPQPPTAPEAATEVAPPAAIAETETVPTAEEAGAAAQAMEATAAEMARATAEPIRTAAADDAELSAIAPSFVRQAERAARWRRPQVRAGLALLALVAAAALAWQLTLTHHDLMAARWPALRPAIERLCLYGGCAIEPPRRIDGLSVESSALVRAGPPGTYRLTLVLRNRDRMALRLPAVDLVLTDALGRTLARRVLTPAQLGVDASSIAAGAELPLAASLRTRDAGVVGYTIEIFYP